MDQEKRVMIAFALSFAVLLLWRTLFMKQPPPPPAPKSEPAASAPSPVKAPPARAAVAPASASLPVTQGREAKDVTVEGGLIRVTFGTQGAVVKSWVLTKYRDEKEEPLDVVNRAACESLGFPLSLILADAELTKTLNSALFVATPADTSLKDHQSVEFVYSDGQVQARKKFSLGPGYEARVEVSVFDGQHFLPVQVAWTGGFGDHSLPPAVAAAVERAAYQVQGGSLKEERLMPSWFRSTFFGTPPKEQEDIPGPLSLAGLEDRYFVGLFLPKASDPAFPPEVAFHIARRAWTPAEWKGEEKDKPKPLLATLGGPTAGPMEFRLFVAPKDLDVLRATTPPLDQVVDFGWFSIVAKPLFIAMRFIYDHWIHNYGWAIILLTVIINLTMFPLKMKQLRSAQEMQKVAPVIKSIQERYKQYKFNDPRKQRMQQEIMKVYQDHGINPLGGCLPMAFQLPFLYGFYNVLNQSIELRHAPWIWWAKDLSSPDRLHLFGYALPVLPVVMIVTMYVLQQMTPMATADPGQQRMMKIMPLVFGFMFFNLASGLVLYWLTGNVVGILQQSFINRMVPASRMKPPTAENTGSGK